MIKHKLNIVFVGSSKQAPTTTASKDSTKTAPAENWSQFYCEITPIASNMHRNPRSGLYQPGTFYSFVLTGNFEAVLALYVNK